MLAQDRPKSHGMTPVFKDYGQNIAEYGIGYLLYWENQYTKMLILSVHWKFLPTIRFLLFLPLPQLPHQIQGVQCGTTVTGHPVVVLTILPDCLDPFLEFENIFSLPAIRVSVQRVKSLGSHFACLCRGFEVKKNIIIFQK